MEVTISLPDLLERLPRYGIGRAGQNFVRYDDVVRTVNLFFDMRERANKKEPSHD